ncbi:ArsR family transcriptional regulator [Desulfosarcina sp.]
MLLLKKKPLSTIDISERLGLNPSDVSKHMNSSSRHGLVRYDTTSNCYALA